MRLVRFWGVKLPIFIIVKLVRKIFWKKPFFRKKEQKDTEKEKIQEKDK